MRRAARAGNARRQRAPAAARAALEGGRTSRAALRHGRARACRAARCHEERVDDSSDGDGDRLGVGAGEALAK